MPSDTGEDAEPYQTDEILISGGTDHRFSDNENEDISGAAGMAHRTMGDLRRDEQERTEPSC